jgi:anthranilate synthase/aminodeoxychorismate synthase-like glutamine amidotransferase
VPYCDEKADSYQPLCNPDDDPVGCPYNSPNAILDAALPLDGTMSQSIASRIPLGTKAKIDARPPEYYADSNFGPIIAEAICTDNSGQCSLGKVGNFTVNGQTSGTITESRRTNLLANISFYAMAYKQHMPIRSIKIDWDDGSVQSNVGYYKNNWPQCDPAVTINASPPDYTWGANATLDFAGPGSPKDARVSNDVLRSVASGELQIPVLGVCLGHQCMGTIFGGEKNVGRAPKAMHGKTSKIFHAGKSVFDGIPSPFLAARYHSLVVKKLPKDFELLAWTEDKVIMGMKHKILPLVGVQFHPESFLTEHGDRVLFHFLSGQW